MSRILSTGVGEGVSVPVCTTGHKTRGSLSRGISVQGDLRPGGSLSRAVQGGLSVLGALSRGSLSGGSLFGGLCPGGSLSRGMEFNENI